MQDGAPAHIALLSRELISEKFEERVVGRYFPIEWCPRSPDLNPLDYFFWGFLKDLVFEDQKGTLTHDVLCQRILDAFQLIRENHMDAVGNAVNSFWDRVDHCLAIDGKQLGNR